MTPDRNVISGGLFPVAEAAPPISSKFFEDIGYLEKHINSSNFTFRAQYGSLEGSRSLSNTLTFLRSIAAAEGRKAMFNRADITRYSSGDTTVTNYNNAAAGETIFTLVDSEPSKTYVYTLVGNNIFDEYLAQKEEQSSKNSMLANSHLLSMDAYYKQSIENWEIKIKTLGIPEMDTLSEISAPRLFNFSIHDLSSELSLNIRKGDPTNVHWLSGMYQPLAIKHSIDSNGYVTEFKLLKNLRLA